MSSKFEKLKAFARSHSASNPRVSTLAMSMNVARRVGYEKRAMAEPNVFERFPSLKSKLELGLIAETLLMMIDLSPFSEVVKEMKPGEIASFLDGYYKIVVAEIGKQNGVVEKYIGDAVIAAFGEPFESSTTEERLKNVYMMSRNLVQKIKDLFMGEVTAKVALAFGSCFLGYVGPDEYEELTIIGNPLTHLFRIESECPPSTVAIEKDYYDRYLNTLVPTVYPGDPRFLHAKWELSQKNVALRGVGPVTLQFATYNG